MSDDFRRLIEEIEVEAKAEGTEVELCEMRREFSIVSQLMTFRHQRS
jgi:hypothetical protein